MTIIKHPYQDRRHKMALSILDDRDDVQRMIKLTEEAEGQALIISRCFFLRLMHELCFLRARMNDPEIANGLVQFSLAFHSKLREETRTWELRMDRTIERT